MKRLLVTGATGFIGSHFVRTALERGWKITALCRKESNFQRLRGIKDEIDWIEMESEYQMSSSRAFTKGPLAATVHFATNYGRGLMTASEVLTSNLIFPLTLVEGCVEHKVPLFINTDTCFPETYEYLKTYTRSKKDFKRWGMETSKKSDTRFLTLELQHPFGPGDGEGKFIPWLIRQCLTQGNVVPLTTGEQRKDFIFVGDVVEAYFCAIERFQQIPDDINTLEIGRGQGVSVRWIAEEINRICGGIASLNFGAVSQREGEIMESKAKLKENDFIDWRAKISVSEGLLETIRRFN